MAKKNDIIADGLKYVENAVNGILRGEATAWVDTKSTDSNHQSLTESGYSIFLNQDKNSSFTPKSRNVVSMSPEAVVLIKKKAFSSLKSSNDLKWMDDTEKMFLRATKALFAIKVQQLRAYESLTKFKDYYAEHKEYNLSLLSQFLKEAESTADAKALKSNDFSGGVFSDIGDVFGYTAGQDAARRVTEEIADIIKRNAFSYDSTLTTWVVDPESEDNYSIGPGTGVIEMSSFFSFTTSCDVSSNPSSATINIENPYRLMTVLEGDIESAIDEAVNGTLGLLSALANGEGSVALGGKVPPIDGGEIISTALEASGLGDILGGTTVNLNHVRERLRSFYLGKGLVNPADSVNFFIRGNRTTESYEDGGGYSSITMDKTGLEVDDVMIRAEMRLNTSGLVDAESYRKLRQTVDNSFGMISVYGGFVKSVSESFQSGKWKMTINCVDNMAWLQWSRFNISPSLSDPKGILEDPLTPFDIPLDDTGAVVYGEGQQLLQENKDLLHSGLLSYDSGLLAGQNASEGNILQGQYNGAGSLDGAKVLQHPSGFVYRWKTGIITATAGFQVADPTQEANRQSQTDRSQYGLTVAEDVLSNLDIANILSVLIIGEPYNVETFMKRTFEAHSRINRSSTTLDPADPLSAVIESVRRQNDYYGNFQPYRMITMSNSTIQQTISAVGKLEVAKNSVDLLQRRKISIKRRISDLRKNAHTQNGILINALEAEIQSISAAISDHVRVGLQAGQISSADNAVIQFSLFGSNPSLPTSSNEAREHDINRATMLLGAQRKIDQVRLNSDNNLFIVSDQYDYNTDLRPFLLRLNRSGWKLFDSDYVDVYNKCTAATSHLKLEFFCNPNGHLEFRPPAWNKVPYSVLEEAINMSRETGRTIIPDFITNMFQTRIDSLYLDIHTQNIRIVLIALMLGRYPDSTLIPNMITSGGDSLEFFGVKSPEPKGFFGNLLGGIPGMSSGATNDSSIPLTRVGDLTEQNNVSLGNGINISFTSTEEKGDVLDADTETILGAFDVIYRESAGVSDDLYGAILGIGTPPATAGGAATVENLNAIRNSFMSKTGRDPAKNLGIDLNIGFQSKDFFFGSATGSDAAERAVDNLLGESDILSKLESAISERDSLVSLLKNNIAKRTELEEIEQMFYGDYGSEDEIKSMSGNSAIAKLTRGLKSIGEPLQAVNRGINAIKDILTGSAAKGSIFDHLIEDDRRNLLGPGSGSRFIIGEENILSASFSENPPEFTRVDIKGDLPLGVADALERSLEGYYLWAGATDFDLWRQYGYKQKNIKVPFISDPESQGRPYAILELQMQRALINKGSVTLAGNEFYRPGDVVYLSEKGLLYYVNSVNHSFSIGQSFTTTLDLTYGHPPGIYLPTPLDVIGQQFAKDPMKHSTITYRNERGDDNYRPLRPDCSLVFPSTPGAGVAELLAYGDNQVRFTNMMIDLAGTAVGNRYVLIRTFVKSKYDNSAKSDAERNSSTVKSLLMDPQQVSHQPSGTSGLDVLMETGRDLFMGTGTSKEVSPMRLPNNIMASPVPEDKILEQIVYLEKEDENTVGTIRCMNVDIAGDLSAAGISISDADILGVFPKGGPKQKTWLDLRIMMSNTENVIEIGIIDIPGSVSEAGG